MIVKGTNDIANKILGNLVELSPVLFQELKEESPRTVPTVPPASKPDPKVMPKIDITDYDSPNQSERGATISGLVVHNTDSSFDSAVSWLCNPAAQASAHLVIGRNGKVACLVDLSKKAWHAGNGRVNATTIGIEVEADENHKGMTAIQEHILIQWIRWSMQKYNFGADKVITHRAVVETSCPCWIFATEQDFAAWKKKNL
jgi:N-acetyl-anhydromuramyl-L-alanine amidase AmpD